MPHLYAKVILRARRLLFVALAAGILCAGYFYVFEPRTAYAAYRCVTAAQPWYACFLSNEFAFRTDLFGFIYEGRVGKGDYVDEFILTQGSYETHVLFFLRDTMLRLEPQAGVFLDVGANSGQHSMFMSRYAAAVHAFEPYPPVLERFRRMLKINNIANVKIHPVGLGREAARLPFDDHDLAFRRSDDKKGQVKLELEIVPGDAALQKAGVGRIDLVKMDIEGFEKSALFGLSETLKRDRPVIVFELTIDPKRPELFSSLAICAPPFPKIINFLSSAGGVFIPASTSFRSWKASCPSTGSLLSMRWHIRSKKKSVLP